MFGAIINTTITLTRKWPTGIILGNKKRSICVIRAGEDLIAWVDCARIKHMHSIWAARREMLVKAGFNSTRIS